MIRSATLAILALAAASSLSFAASTPGKWLHVTVDEKGKDGERVRVNLPMSLIEKVLPLIETDELNKGTVDLEGCEIDGVDLREILSAVTDAEDGEYVTVDGPDEKARVVKKDAMLLIDVEETDGAKEKVHIKIRLDLIDALLSGDPDQLDLLAAVRSLGDDDEGMLVTVDSDDESVRIWIDTANSGE